MQIIFKIFQGTCVIHFFCKLGRELYCTTVYAVHLAVILIWRFGGFSFDHQIKITTNTVVLSQVLINSNDKRAYLPN